MLFHSKQKHQNNQRLQDVVLIHLCKFTGSSDFIYLYCNISGENEDFYN